MIIIFMGVSGSGKTTIARLLAERLDWTFYDGDDFHTPENVARMRQGIPLTDQDRQAWLSALANQITTDLKNNTSAVLACSALKQKYRDQLQVDSRVHFVYLKGSYEQILARMRLRGGHFMKPDMLPSQFAALEEPADALTIDIALEPQAILARVLEWIQKFP